MKETYFSGVIFVNGKKSCIASYDNGTHRVLYFGKTLGTGIGIDDLKDSGCSLHQFTNSLEIPSPDETGIQAVIADAVVDLPDSEEYKKRIEAAAGSRSGKTAVTPTTVVATKGTTDTRIISSSDFICPATKDVPALAELAKLIPNLETTSNEYGVKLAMSLINDAETPDMPKLIKTTCQIVPTLINAINEYQAVIKTAVASYVEEIARKQAEETARKQAEEAALNGKTVLALSDGTTVEVKGKVHPVFKEALEDLKEFHCIYLHGPAGTGKSFMCRQLAEALGVECYISSQSTLKYDLLGTYNVKGEHIYTAFTRAAVNGGVWLWDEYDRSSPDSCTAINDALANGRVDIPGIGMVDLHPNFYCVAAGNTCGFGGSSKYTAAQQQDYASLTRFLSKISIDYCREMDLIVTNNDTALCDFVEAVRKAIKETSIEIDVPIRVLKPLQQKAKRTNKQRALECCLFAGIGATQIKQISARVKGSGAWFDALTEYAKSLTA